MPPPWYVTCGCWWSCHSVKSKSHGKFPRSLGSHSDSSSFTSLRAGPRARKEASRRCRRCVRPQRSRSSKSGSGSSRRSIDSSPAKNRIRERNPRTPCSGQPRWHAGRVFMACTFGIIFGNLASSESPAGSAFLRGTCGPDQGSSVCLVTPRPGLGVGGLVPLGSTSRHPGFFI